MLEVAFAVVALALAVGFWIHHRSLAGIVSDLNDVKKDVQNVKAAISPAPVVPPKV